MKQSVPASVLAIALAACGEGPSLEKFCEDATGSTEVRSQMSRDSSALVVAIFAHSGDHAYFCSGALVGPSRVLTAAHCVHGRADWSFDIYFDEDLRSAKTPVAAKYASEHPTADLALLKLDTARAIDTPPRWSAHVPTPGQRDRLTVTGYGGPGGDITRCLRVSDGAADVVVDPANGERLAVLLYPPSHPGDSGGPLFWEEDGGPILLGVLSEVTGWDTTRGSMDFFPRLLEDDAWVVEALATAPVPLP